MADGNGSIAWSSFMSWGLKSIEKLIKAMSFIFHILTLKENIDVNVWSVSVVLAVIKLLSVS